MINYFIYAKDISGSTIDVPYYHNNGLKTLSEFKNDVDSIRSELETNGEATDNFKIIYLHWGEEEKVVQTYKDIVSSHMRTKPESIVKWIKSILLGDYKIKLLYIITDGDIDIWSKVRCFKLNHDMYYENVVFHTFNEYIKHIDLSIAPSFIKNRCKIYRNYELIDNVAINKEFDYDKVTIDNFEHVKNNLQSYIKIKYLNTKKGDDLALQGIGELENLKSRLLNELSIKLSKSNIDLNTKDKNIFLRRFIKTHWYRNLMSPENDEKRNVEIFTAVMINYMLREYTKCYSFNPFYFDIKLETTDRDEHMADFSSEPEVEFPDMIQDVDIEIPVIILTPFNLLDKIIFRKTKKSGEVSPASFNKFKSTMECPLFLVNDQDISESIGYLYTLNVFKQFLESSYKTEPHTRRPFHGGLVLSDTHHFDKYNDYILSATYFDSKKINYNIGLFYYVLWKNCENKEWMDKNVLEQLKLYVMRRISETVCKIGLSSLPLDPQQDTSLLTALWYCVELSSLIFKHEPLHYTHERLRMYYGVAHCMIEILKHFHYDLDLETIEKRRDLITYVMSLKRIVTPSEKAYYVLEKIFENVNGFLVSEINKPFNVKRLNYLKLNHNAMLRDDIIDEKVEISDYVHVMHFVGNTNESEGFIGTVKICDKTFRPLFIVSQNATFYSELLKITQKVIIKEIDNHTLQLSYDTIHSLEFDRILSLYNLFIDCVRYLKKYPTLSDYMMFISMKKKFTRNLVTIFPTNVYEGAKDVYRRYQNIVNKVNVTEFIKVFKMNVSRLDRIKTEGTVKFYDDDEIKEFIHSEESKVNVTKMIW